MSKKSLQILLIEDDLAEKKRLDKIFKEIQDTVFKITFCKSLNKGLKKLTTENFDVILLDLNLSDQEILESLQTLNESYPTLPIVVLTNSNNETFITEISQKSADYLLKIELNSPLLKRCLFYVIERKKTDLALIKARHELEEFAYIVSHDLKQPLSTISCWTQMLYMRNLKQLDEKGQKYVTSILNGTRQMDHLIDDLLNYSRIGTKKKQFQPTNCQELIKQILLNLENIITENKAIITYNSLPTITVDYLLWRQLLQNLIENGIKFHREEPPKIHISAQLKEDQEWVFCVTDNGIGIESEYYQKIFQIFQRLHPQSEYSGSGMGLAICDRIIKSHGGKIWVESEPGKGSSFYFTIFKDL